VIFYDGSKILTRIFSVFTSLSLLLLFFTPQAVAAEKLTTHMITPPIPASRYIMPYTPSPVGLEKYALGIAEKKRVFYLYVPRSLKPHAPAMILLHGAERDGISMADSWRKSAERRGMILVAPDAVDHYWDFDADKAFIAALLQFLQQDKRVDARRIYLFGHSNGAVVGLPLVALFSQNLAAAAIHAGMVTNKKFLPVIKASKRKIPLCVINGSDDASMPAIRARYAAQLFADAGHPAAYIELTGHNHWYYTLSDWINELAWQCMSDLAKK
jgi:predicted esterase